MENGSGNAYRNNNVFSLRSWLLSRHDAAVVAVVAGADDQVGQDAAVPGEALGRQGGVLLLRGEKKEEMFVCLHRANCSIGQTRLESHSRKLRATCLHGSEGGGGHRVVLPGQVLQRGRLLLLKGRKVSKV